MSPKITRSRLKLGKKIQKARKALRLSQEELAGRVRSSRTHIGHIEQGRKSPSMKLLQRIARTLKVKVKDLIPY